jgi:hypothetical protein
MLLTTDVQQKPLQPCKIETIMSKEKEIKKKGEPKLGELRT